MSSSSLNHENNNDKKLLNHLFDLHSNCVKYQCLLIENFYLHHPNHLRNDIIDIIKELKEERENPAINLAGRMILDLTLIADEGEWSITTNPDFLKNLTQEDRALIEQKINPKKFSEDDIRLVLQDLLISKFDLFLNIDNKQDAALPTLLKQYKFLFIVHMQLDACLQSIEKNDRVQLKDQLRKLDDFMNANTGLFSESRKIGFFRIQTPLPQEFKNMLHEVSETLKLSKEQMHFTH
jgi:hypothetical protein